MSILRPATWAVAAVMGFVGVLAGCATSSRHEPVVQATKEPSEHVASSGRVEEGAFRSGAVDDTLHYAAYLPAGYDTSAKRYPVIYALHGLPDGSRGYQSMDVAGWGDDAQRAGRPGIIIAPQGARAGDADPEWHDWGPGRNWQTAIAQELVRHIDATYRTIADRRGRALIGVSAGGYGASIIGVRHPRTYSVIQSWSGYFHPTNPEGDAPLEVGSPEDNDAASVHSYVDVAKRHAGGSQAIRLGFYVGDEDPHFVPENQQLHKELLAAGVEHDYAVYPGAHTDSFWAEHQEEWVTAAVKRLAPSN